MMPIWTASKPIADRYAGKIMIAKPSPSPRTPRAVKSKAMSVRIDRILLRDIRLPNTKAERDCQAATVNRQPNGGDHGEGAEATARPMDHKPSNESNDDCA